MIHILAVSDEQALRGRLPELERVDMLISCGDLPPSYTEVLIHRYAPQHRVMTYGNHDEIFFHDKNPASDCYCRVYKGMYVLDGGVCTFKEGDSEIAVGGYSGAPAYGNNPFFFSESAVKSYIRKLKFKNFFKDCGIDIMISHSAPFFEGFHPNIGAFHEPSASLAEAAGILNPRLWFYGHIHPRYTPEILNFYVENLNMYLINAIPYVYVVYDPETREVQFKEPEKPIRTI
ncbi:MAG: metallophosphoesterase [Desulfarculaceae bacterium]|nr:metallophosphoesterase [Desulfarculaceae bacterium]